MMGLGSRKVGGINAMMLTCEGLDVVGSNAELRG